MKLKVMLLNLLMLLTGILSPVLVEASLNGLQLNPITHHVQSAILLNKTRKHLYRDNFGEESFKVFKRLILVEKLMLPPSWYFDLRAKSYLKAGVPIFLDDLVAVELTPIFSNEKIYPQSEEIVYSEAKTKSDIKFLKLMTKEVANGKIPLRELTAKVKQLIIDSKNDSHHNCLVRHFLESIHLGLYNLPQHRLKAQSLKMNDPLELALDFALVQINALKYMNALDRMAYPLQKDGIPIFCQDIPPIPVP